MYIEEIVICVDVADVTFLIFGMMWIYIKEEGGKRRI